MTQAIWIEEGSERMVLRSGAGEVLRRFAWSEIEKFRIDMEDGSGLRLDPQSGEDVSIPASHPQFFSLAQLAVKRLVRRSPSDYFPQTWNRATGASDQLVRVALYPVGTFHAFSWQAALMVGIVCRLGVEYLTGNQAIGFEVMLGAIVLYFIVGFLLKSRIAVYRGFIRVRRLGKTRDFPYGEIDAITPLKWGWLEVRIGSQKFWATDDWRLRETLMQRWQASASEV